MTLAVPFLFLSFIVMMSQPLNIWGTQFPNLFREHSNLNNFNCIPLWRRLFLFRYRWSPVRNSERRQSIPLTSQICSNSRNNMSGATEPQPGQTFQTSHKAQKNVKRRKNSSGKEAQSQRLKKSEQTERRSQWRQRRESWCHFLSDPLSGF